MPLYHDGHILELSLMFDPSIFSLSTSVPRLWMKSWKHSVTSKTKIKRPPRKTDPSWPRTKVLYLVINQCIATQPMELQLLTTSASTRTTPVLPRLNLTKRKTCEGQSTATQVPIHLTLTVLQGHPHQQLLVRILMMFQYTQTRKRRSLDLGL